MYEAVLTVCLSMPIGCVQESGTEYPGSETDGAATAVVTLQVGAAGNVQTRAYCTSSTILYACSCKRF